jgi:hypothetical protein
MFFESFFLMLYRGLFSIFFSIFLECLVQFLSLVKKVQGGV